MPLPRAAETRQLKHRRAISVQAYSRGDGLWEIDAEVSDVKTRDSHNVAGIRPAGQPIHDLLLRLVIDERFNILEAGAESLSMPYPGHCDQHGDTYSLLTGLNLMSGFKRAVRELVGGARGCTHLTELADVLPTAVVQAFAGDVIDTHGQGDHKPFQIDRCHALVSEGEVVRLHYPRWYQPQPSADTAPGARPAQAHPGSAKLSQNRDPATPTGEPPRPDAVSGQVRLHPEHPPGRSGDPVSVSPPPPVSP
ncbi:MAG TPA: DUF2889 domain-containing protein [Ideonella sp.]|nr:DUF2889 domain-containing protein [Ideonella sp.]